MAQRQCIINKKIAANDFVNLNSRDYCSIAAVTFAELATRMGDIGETEETEEGEETEIDQPIHVPELDPVPA